MKRYSELSPQLKRFLRHPFAWIWTWRLREFTQLPNDEAKDRILAELADATDGMPSAGLFMQALAVAVFFGIREMLVTLASLVWPAAMTMVDWIAWLLLAITIIYFAWWIRRRSAKFYLRLRLNEIGVPICEHCGHLLLHMPSDSSRCPECGRAFTKAAVAAHARTSRQ